MKTLAIGVAAAAVSISGCGGDDSATGPDAQPATDGTAFTEGDFDNIPIFRGATEIQAPVEKEGNIAASYETKTADPDRVLAFYQDELPRLGWTVVVPVAEIGDNVWKGSWLKDDRRLEVSSSPMLGRDEPKPRTQFNLVLLDDAGGSGST
ncbi:MAG: hypothetical protein AB7L17_08860 [Ilumatobacteraceae bacterium]|jgi:hypothetical protein